jgi:hypothetical protein
MGDLYAEGPEDEGAEMGTGAVGVSKAPEGVLETGEGVATGSVVVEEKDDFPDTSGPAAGAGDVSSSNASFGDSGETMTFPESLPPLRPSVPGIIAWQAEKAGTRAATIKSLQSIDLIF